MCACTLSLACGRCCSTRPHAWLVLTLVQIFLGTLREIELERVKEKLSSAIMETCLALTIFREEFNIGFVGMFTVLTFVKVGETGCRQLCGHAHRADLCLGGLHGVQAACLCRSSGDSMLPGGFAGHGSHMQQQGRRHGSMARTVQHGLALLYGLLCHALLLLAQVFHWLVEDRVDYIEVTPSVSRLAHVRIVSFLMVLLVRG